MTTEVPVIDAVEDLAVDLPVIEATLLPPLISFDSDWNITTTESQVAIAGNLA
jgi:hypothetical protein